MVDVIVLPCEPTTEQVPSREMLTDFERLLTRFQFECENAGLWPGALTLTELKGFSSAPHTLAELYWLIAAAKVDERFGVSSNPYISITGWSGHSCSEIRAVFDSAKLVINHLLGHWRHHYGTGDGEDPVFCDGDGNLVIHFSSTQPHCPIPAEIAAVVERCARRLRVLLQNSPNKPPMETSQATQTTHAVKRPGRPKNPFLPAIKRAVLELWKKDTSYEEIQKHVKTTFDVTYSLSYLKELRQQASAEKQGEVTQGEVKRD